MTAERIINEAKKYVGIAEEYNNKVIFNKEYYGSDVSGDAYKWCLVFVWYVFKKAGASSLFYDGQKTAYTPTMMNWFRQNQCFYSTPMPGDLVFFKFGGTQPCNHVGIVVEVKGNMIRTIEGNTSDGSQTNGGMVMYRDRDTKNVVGYGRPRYKTSSYPMRGVDVSGYNTGLDYAAMLHEGIQFAFVKIMRRDLTLDHLYNHHLTNFKAVGIPVIGVYNYSYATTVEKAKSDAKAVIKYLLGDTDKVVALDVEDDCQKNLGHLLIDIIKAYQNVIESVGNKFVVYTGLSFYNTFIKKWEHELDCPMWIARYYLGDTVMYPTSQLNDQYKPVVKNLIGWQYTSKGSTGGKLVDLDILYGPIARAAKETVISNVVTANSLNIRKGPGTRYGIVGVLSNGQTVEVSAVNGKWLQIGKDQWVSGNYIQSAKGTVNANSLNVRSSDSTAGSIVAVVKKGDVLPLYAQSPTGWYLTTNGWVSNNYVST